MALESEQLSVVINRPVEEVYAYAADPLNLSAWAAGLGSAIVQEDDHWYVDTPGGRVELVFAPSKHRAEPLGPARGDPAVLAAGLSGQDPS